MLNTYVYAFFFLTWLTDLFYVTSLHIRRKMNEWNVKSWWWWWLTVMMSYYVCYYYGSSLALAITCQNRICYKLMGTIWGNLRAKKVFHQHTYMCGWLVKLVKKNVLTISNTSLRLWLMHKVSKPCSWWSTLKVQLNQNHCLVHISELT